MKSLMLLNARRRRKTRKSRRNPTASQWMSAAGSRRRKTRRIRRSRARVTARVIRRGKRTATVKFIANPKRRPRLRLRLRRRGSRLISVRARANPRRRMRRNPMLPSFGNITSQVRSLLSKENLTLAAGGIAAGALTSYVVNLKRADNTTPLLPMPTSPELQKVAAIAYAVGIPFVGAIVTRRFSPAAAKGMLFAGLVSGAQTAIRQYASPEIKKVLGMGEYLDYTPTSAVGQLPPSYMAASRFAGVRPVNGALNNSSAFPSDAWA
jgi:hypothetical protein